MRTVHTYTNDAPILGAEEILGMAVVLRSLFVGPFRERFDLPVSERRSRREDRDKRRENLLRVSDEFGQPVPGHVYSGPACIGQRSHVPRSERTEQYTTISSSSFDTGSVQGPG